MPNFLRDLEDRLERDRQRRGHASAELSRQFRLGTVWTVKDEAIQFPTDRLPQSGERTLHGERRVILLQQTSHCQQDALLTILVVPCSASQERGSLGPWMFPIPDEEPGFSKSGVIAFASLLQPILKQDLLRICGTLRPETLGALLSTVFVFQGGKEMPGVR